MASFIKKFYCRYCHQATAHKVLSEQTGRCTKCQSINLLPKVT